MFDDARFTRILYTIEFLCFAIFFSAIFLAVFRLLSNRCPQRIMCGELALPFNVLFVYHIVLFYILYRPSVKWDSENYIGVKSSVQCWAWKIFTAGSIISSLSIPSNEQVSKYTYFCYYIHIFNYVIVMDLFQPKTDLFSTRARIWVHFKSVHYFSQPIYSLFSYLNNAIHNSMTKLCSAFFKYENKL